MDQEGTSQTRISSLTPVLLALVLCIPAAARAQTYDVLHNFIMGPVAPQAPLLQATDGSFYGTTQYGGRGYCFEGCGTVFRTDSAGNVTPLHSFDGTDGGRPIASLIQAADGEFYGTTHGDGTQSAYGSVFKMDSSGNFTLIHSFTGYGTDGVWPYAGLIQAADGNFYGTTSYGGGPSGSGTVFKIDSSGNLTTFHIFSGGDGAYPYAGLIQASDGNFYGATSAGGTKGSGTIFKMDSAGNVTILHNFDGLDGAGSSTSLIQASDGNFYGTTSGGGSDGFGTVFKMDSFGEVTTLHSFKGMDGANPYAGLVQAADGNFYGTTLGGGPNSYGTVFRIDSAGNLTTLHNFSGSPNDGAGPYANLIQASDANFYATTPLGGAGACTAGCGTIFKMDSSGNLTILHGFDNSDGAYPFAGLLQAADGNFYGGTQLGGSGYCTFQGDLSLGCGTIFKMDNSGNVTTLHSFDGGDGSFPIGPLLQAHDGTFYGTTTGGGLGGGTVFKMDFAGNVATLYSFGSSPNDGSGPFGGLIEATDGDFYGTTYWFSTVFKVNSSGNLTTLTNFVGTNGANPIAGLLQGTDGNFYGTTEFGGVTGNGTIFRMDSSGNLTMLHDFTRTGADGGWPHSPLIEASDGNFYGTTFYGGTSDNGIVFRMDSSGNVTTLYSFGSSPSDGVNPAAGLIQASDGNFYGATQYGGTGSRGTVFEIDSSGNLTALHDFLNTDGEWPYSGLIQAADGNLYGTTSGGGIFGAGVVFRLGLCLPPVASSNSPVCAGQKLQLSAYPSASATYSWTGPNGFASTLQAPTIPNATAADSGTYSVTVTAGTCAPAQATVSVAVNAGTPPAPVIASSLCVPANSPGLTASVTANPGDVYTWTIFGGTIDSGQGTSSVSFTSGEAGTQVRLSVVESNTSCSGSDTALIQTDFGDVPASTPFHDFICTIARNGITAGCGGGNFCPGNSVLRSQMPVFLLRGEHGSAYVPPAADCGAYPFSDVPCPSAFADYILQAYNEGITSGCGANPLVYCPSNSVTRSSMAVFLLRGKYGPAYTPPACAGIFTDVACPSPFADWIEALHAAGIASGCWTNPLMYCPTSPVTRGQMAVFLTATFNLP